MNVFLLKMTDEMKQLETIRGVEVMNNKYMETIRLYY